MIFQLVLVVSGIQNKIEASKKEILDCMEINHLPTTKTLFVKSLENDCYFVQYTAVFNNRELFLS